MHSKPTTRSTSSTTQRPSPRSTAGVAKRSNQISNTQTQTPSTFRRSSSSPSRKPQKYFSYRSASGQHTRIANAPAYDPPTNPRKRPSKTTTTTRPLALYQIDDYTYSPRLFKSLPLPQTFPTNSVWPPKDPLDIMRALGDNMGDCVGAVCYTRKRCRTAHCAHTFASWRRVSGDDWEDHFELRETPDGRGVGVYTKKAFKKRATLGWYAGTVVPFNCSDSLRSDYLMDVSVGNMDGYILNQVFGPSVDANGNGGVVGGEGLDFEPYPEDTVWVDGARYGNWTRFINHSCDAYAEFENMRVGGTRIMAVVARCDVPAGVELTVDYGDGYWTARGGGCGCGVEWCEGGGLTKKEKEKERKSVERLERAVERRRRVRDAGLGKGGGAGRVEKGSALERVFERAYC